MAYFWGGPTGMEAVYGDGGDSMSRFPPPWTGPPPPFAPPPPGPPPPPAFGHTVEPDLPLWHSAQRQSQAGPSTLHNQPAKGKGRGHSSAPYPQSHRARVTSTPSSGQFFSDQMSLPYPPPPYPDQSEPGSSCRFSSGPGGEFMDFTSPQPVGFSSQGVSSYTHGGGRVCGVSGKTRGSHPAQGPRAQNGMQHWGRGRGGAGTGWDEHYVSAGSESEGRYAHSYSHRDFGMRGNGGEGMAGNNRGSYGTRGSRGEGKRGHRGSGIRGHGQDNVADRHVVHRYDSTDTFGMDLTESELYFGK